jgi:hypothetical protein
MGVLRHQILTSSKTASNCGPYTNKELPFRQTLDTPRTHFGHPGHDRNESYILQKTWLFSLQLDCSLLLRKQTSKKNLLKGDCNAPSRMPERLSSPADFTLNCGFF